MEKNDTPKGLINQNRSLQAFDLKTYAPGKQMGRLVEYFWSVRWDLPPGEVYKQANLPHPVAHIVIDPQVSSGFYTPARGAFDYEVKGCGAVLGARLWAGAGAAFYNGPLSQLRGGPVAFAPQAQSRLQDLANELQSTLRPKSMIRDFEALLIRVAGKVPAQGLRAGALVARAGDNPQMMRAEALAASEDISLRHLQRLFAQYIGVSPKWVIDRFRMLEALSELNRGAPVDFADLAFALGFTDQPHFIARFKALTGTSPAKYLKAQNISSAGH